MHDEGTNLLFCLELSSHPVSLFVFLLRCIQLHSHSTTTTTTTTTCTDSHFTTLKTNYITQWESAPRRSELPESTEPVTVVPCVNCCARLRYPNTPPTDASFAVRIPSSASVPEFGTAAVATRRWPVDVTPSVRRRLLPCDRPLDVFVVFKWNLLRLLGLGDRLRERKWVIALECRWLLGKIL